MVSYSKLSYILAEMQAFTDPMRAKGLKIRSYPSLWRLRPRADTDCQLTTTVSAKPGTLAVRSFAYLRDQIEAIILCYKFFSCSGMSAALEASMWAPAPRWSTLAPRNAKLKAILNPRLEKNQ